VAAEQQLAGFNVPRRHDTTPRTCCVEKGCAAVGGGGWVERVSRCMGCSVHCSEQAAMERESSSSKGLPPLLRPLLPTFDLHYLNGAYVRGGIKCQQLVCRGLQPCCGC
jgi:hypothetical protein